MKIKIFQKPLNHRQRDYKAIATTHQLFLGSVVRESPEATHSHFHNPHPTTQRICIRSVSAFGRQAKDNLMEFKFIKGKCAKLHKWLCEAGE